MALNIPFITSPEQAKGKAKFADDMLPPLAPKKSAVWRKLALSAIRSVPSGGGDAIDAPSSAALKKPVREEIFALWDAPRTGSPKILVFTAKFALACGSPPLLTTKLAKR